MLLYPTKYCYRNEFYNHGVITIVPLIINNLEMVEIIEVKSNTWIAGLVLNIIGSILVNFGTNLVKYFHNNHKSHDHSVGKDIEMTTFNSNTIYISSNHKEQQYCAIDDLSTIGYDGEKFRVKHNTKPSSFCVMKPATSNLWYYGAAWYTIGSAMVLVSFALAAQTLIAALGGIQFVSNIIFAKIIHHEPINTTVVAATVLLIVGTSVAIVFSSQTTRIYSRDTIIELYDEQYLAFLSCIIVITSFAELFYYALTVWEDCLYRCYTIFRPILYAFVSTVVGTQAVLQAKCVAEIVKYYILNDSKGGVTILFSWTVFLMFVAFVIGTYFWLNRLNNGLKMFDATTIIPTFQCFWICSAIIQGGIFFHEFYDFSFRQIIGFTIGIIISLVGVYLVASAGVDTITTANNSKQKETVDTSKTLSFE